MVHVNVKVSLSNKISGYHDELIVADIEDPDHFSYLDNDGSLCEIEISPKGLRLFKSSHDHLLNLYLDGDNYAEIITGEGKLRIDVKVLDFTFDSDILVIRYLIEDEERVIELRFC